MGVVHAFECLAHGLFESRVKAGEVPKCPKGCSKDLVTLVFVQAPGFVGARTRKADQLLREAAEMQGLSDISTSPSRPGGSVADRNRKKNLQRIRLPDGSTGYVQPSQAAVSMQAPDFGRYVGALTHRENTLSTLGFGHKYDSSEWTKNEATGNLHHTGAKLPNLPIPTGSTGVSIERVKERKK